MTINRQTMVMNKMVVMNTKKMTLMMTSNQRRAMLIVLMENPEMRGEAVMALRNLRFTKVGQRKTL